MNLSVPHAILVCIALVMRCSLPIRVATVEQGTVGNGNPIERLRTEAKIGQEVFFWMWVCLLRPMGQACVSRHLCSTAFADPRPVAPGAFRGRNGRRNAPSLVETACELARCDC